LKIADRQGVEIDYCPQCRGVWLDRGELDKIIERSAVSAAPAGLNPGRRRDDDDDDDRYEKPRYEKKKRSFLDDIFDF
jgi:Zn-finger nucleic acid-binding protein